jgi:hypothetical protein
MNPAAMGEEENQKWKENLAGADEEDEEDSNGAPPKKGGDEQGEFCWPGAPLFAGLNADIVSTTSDDVATPSRGGGESPHSLLFPSHQHYNVSPTTRTRSDFNNSGEEGEKDDQKRDQSFHGTLFGESGGNEANNVDEIVSNPTSIPEFHPAALRNIPSIAAPCFSSSAFLSCAAVVSSPDLRQSVLHQEDQYNTYFQFSDVNSSSLSTWRFEGGADGITSQFLHDRISRKRTKRTPTSTPKDMFCLPSCNTSPKKIDCLTQDGLVGEC